MPLMFYNTLTREKEPFTPIKGRSVGMYTCGPTVYGLAHIGNLRAFVFYDLVKKYLRFRGFSVNHVMNITDVDDKTIRNSKEAGVSLREFTEKHTALFLNDMEKMGIEKPDVMPKATEHISEMVSLVTKLLEKGHAYKGGDGSVYFRISSFPGYGKLSKLEMKGLKTGARVNNDEYDKDHAMDFALWKAWTEGDGEVFWETGIGKGRPGWHIECSAMSGKYLGTPFDIHCGGVDLIFPHHENEIAQSEAATGRGLAKFWLHNEHLLVDGKKMSKSLGNFLTLQDVEKEGTEPRTLRFAFLSSHYRSKLNITEKSLYASKQALERVDNFMDLLKEAKGKDSKEAKKLIEKAGNDFKEHMDNDLDSPQAIAVVFELMKDANRHIDSGMFGPGNAAECRRLMENMDSVLGILRKGKEADSELIGKVFSVLLDLRGDLKDSELGKRVDLILKKEKSFTPGQRLLDDLMADIVEIREELRKRKDYGLSDKIRAELLNVGIVLEDKEKGVRWRRV